MKSKSKTPTHEEILAAAHLHRKNPSLSPHRVQRRHVPDTARVTAVRELLREFRAKRRARMERARVDDWVRSPTAAKHARFRQLLAERWQKREGMPIPFHSRNTAGDNGEDLYNLTDLSLCPKAALYKLEGYVRYTSTKRYPTYSAELLLYDEHTEEWHIIRVPPVVRTVREALEETAPAKVRRAEQEGLRTVRQGTLYFYEAPRARKFDTKLLEEHGYTVERTPSGEWLVKHPKYPPLLWKHPFKVARMRSYL